VVPVIHEENSVFKETCVSNFSDAQDKPFTKRKPIFAPVLVHLQIQYRQLFSHLWKTQSSKCNVLARIQENKNYLEPDHDSPFPRIRAHLWPPTSSSGRQSRVLQTQSPVIFFFVISVSHLQYSWLHIHFSAIGVEMEIWQQCYNIISDFRVVTSHVEHEMARACSTNWGEEECI
jgi:hypothetical protein